MMRWKNHLHLFLICLPVVETSVRTCVEEASGSAKPSGYSTYGMPPCCTNYRSRYVEQFVKLRASGLDPA
eukprot:2679739-Ditylum_brightwellii.AAC.1